MMQKISRQLSLTFAALIGISGLGWAGEPAPVIPLEDFFRNPETANYKISPDGRHFAFLAPYETRMNVHVRPVEGGEAIRITSDTERDIYSYFWLDDERLIYGQDRAGDENTRLFAVNLDGSDFMELTPEGVRAGVVDDLKNDPLHMMIMLNERDPRLFDVYQLNVKTGERELLVENPGNFMGYSTDHAGQVRFTFATDGVNVRVLYRDDNDSEWDEVIAAPWTEQFSVLRFTEDNRKVWALSSIGRDKIALVIWDTETRSEEEVIFAHPQVDLYSADFSERDHKLLAVSFLAAYRTYVYFDESYEAMVRKLEKKLAPLQVRIADVDREEKRWLVHAFDSRTQGTTYFYDAESGNLEELATLAPWLNPDHMAVMRPITYESRDGLFIHGYLTLPVGVKAKNLPLIVHPHGGPQARDTWGFRSTPQFLANRGYAVFQPNFRGSTGFGKHFMKMGFREWGRAMQDDITDGVHYLVDLGIVDPDRVGIYGASYGGYAVLAGLTFTPEVYAAGVSYVGPSSLFTLMDSVPPYWEPMREMLYEMVGHPVEDEALVRAASPLYHVENIRAPLMILQGANDPRVKQAESDQIVRELRSRDIPVPYMLKKNEGHGFSNEENQFHANRAVEQFFARYLGGRQEEVEDVLAPLYETVLEGVE